jgi:triosephosphate isomerase
MYPFTRRIFSKNVIACEPVWAISTGKVATTAQAEETYADIRTYLVKAVSPAVANNIKILYDGNVTTAN